MSSIISLFVLLSSQLVLSQSDDTLTDILQNGVDTKAYPGATAMVRELLSRKSFDMLYNWF